MALVMNIGIKEITRGRFGNRILQYNSLMQMAKELNMKPYCVKWEGHDWFENLCETKVPEDTGIDVNWDRIINDSYKNLNCNFTVGGYAIHNCYFKLTKMDPRNFFKVKKEFLPNFDNTINVGIHIRGGDILHRNGKVNPDHKRLHHDLEYYKKAINEVLLDNSNITSIYICTDDMSYPLVHDVFKYSKSVFNNTKWGTSTNNKNLPHIYDFALLTECDYLICGSSTYCVTEIGRAHV